MDADFEARLRSGDVAFDASDAALLAAVDDHGSLNAAADGLDRSYARSHRRLKALEAAFGPLVERRRGGADGGGSHLTEHAREVTAALERLAAGYERIASREERVLAGRVVDREGELAAVQTAAGTVRALAHREASAVEVTVGSDAITLTTPGDAPSPGGTSARNRLAGTVADVDRGEAVARVAVDVGATEPLVALITTESADQLDLAPDQPVVASFKATATRATPAGPEKYL